MIGQQSPDNVCCNIRVINDIQHVLDVHDNRKWNIYYHDYEEHFQQQDEESVYVYQQNLTILVQFDQVLTRRNAYFNIL